MLLSDICKGMSVEDKAKTLKEYCEVTSFNEFNRKNNDELDIIITNLLSAPVEDVKQIEQDDINSWAKDVAGKME